MQETSSVLPSVSQSIINCEDVHKHLITVTLNLEIYK